MPRNATIFEIKYEIIKKIGVLSTSASGWTKEFSLISWNDLDPKEVHGEDFPGETFRVLKEKEVKAYGGALRRTSRLASGAWDKGQE